MSAEKNTTEITYDEYIANFNIENPKFVSSNGSHPLNDKWVLWMHQPASKCNRWDLASYKQHCVISTVEDFWNLFNGMKSLVNEDMWFLMRHGIPPRWEDPVNKEGGSFKFKVPGDRLDNCWLTLAMHLVTETMCVNMRDSKLISGISTSPKQHNFSTLSIWNLDSAATDCKQFPSNVEGIDFKMSLYQAHNDRKHG